jgi:lauroyl/myristoyl acyltransferase
MRLLPRPSRFGAALLVARAAVPLVRRTEAYREMRRHKVDGAREIALHLLLFAMTNGGAAYEPSISVRGYEEVRRAYASGKGLLVVQPHTMLSMLLHRRFHDDGLGPVGIGADPLMRVAGTALTAEIVPPSPTFLVKTRSLLRAGRLVNAMLDRGEHREGRTLEFDTAAGPVVIAPALIHVAARCGASVLFAEVHVEGRGVAATVAAPSPGSFGSGEAITKEFIEFVRAHIEARSARRDGARP